MSQLFARASAALVVGRAPEQGNAVVTAAVGVTTGKEWSHNVFLVVNTSHAQNGKRDNPIVHAAAAALSLLKKTKAVVIPAATHEAHCPHKSVHHAHTLSRDTPTRLATLRWRRHRSRNGCAIRTIGPKA